MTGHNRNKKKQKENECPRFKQHNQKTLTNNSEEVQRKNSDSKQGTKVIASSSNLSRNVASNINSPEDVLVRRTDAISNATTSSMPSKGLKHTKVVAAHQTNVGTPLVNPMSFEPGPPPTINSLHRLNKKVSDVQSELDKADTNSDEAGLKLAEEKLAGSPTSKKNFQKSVSKCVDISPEEQLYSSLANISLSSTSFDSRIDVEHNFWVASESKKGRDPEPKLEWFHQPYKGTEVLVHPSNEIYKMLSEESFRIERERLISTPIESDYNMYDD